MLKQLKKFEAADCREAHAIEYNLLALEIQRHISPGFHVGRNEVGCVGIIAAQKFERTLGKHNAEPPCRVRQGSVRTVRLSIAGGAFSKGTRNKGRQGLRPRRQCACEHFYPSEDSSETIHAQT